MKDNKICSISVDMDPIGHYLKARGYTPSSKTNLNAVYDDALPRMVEIFDRYDIKATFFIVGKDLKNKENRIRIHSLAENGHEIANHTYSHFQNFFELSNKSKQIEIENADKIISDCIGKKVNGFRAPGWGISIDTFEVLEKNSYYYDSSIFPSKLLSIIAYANYILNKGKLKRSLGSSSRIGSSPKLPYRPDSNKLWKKGKASVVEIPLTILPYFQFPFLGSTLYLLGTSFFDICFSYFKLFNRPLVYEFHGLDQVDYHSSIKDKRLLVKPGLGKNIDEKVNLYSHCLSKFSRNYSFKTMHELAKSLKV
tara:strand:- start:46 stop:975 length:930 start_codon:yes stop_codon:yes gene_type:complete